ncbi:MAG: SPOR domain-containing protein [Paludibacteraceae bacterium]|nr:SPOR domain-containing protein [Paludibacteraceae bacterium]
MKRVLIISLVVLASLSMWAQELKGNPLRPNLADSLTGVELIQDSTVGVLLNAVMRGKLELVELDGYRVQVYSSNQQQTAKAEALNLEEKLKDKINQTVYVQYIPPFWKVRIGDFRTYNEAKEYKNEFVELYPKLMGDTYIVRDKIQVWQ